METPKEGQRVLATFTYGGKEVQSPVEYKHSKYILSFWNTDIPINPLSWEPLASTDAVAPAPITKPKMLDRVVFAEVIKLAEEMNDSVVNGDYNGDTDDEHYLYEAVMEALYGKEYWEWFNANT